MEENGDKESQWHFHFACCTQTLPCRKYFISYVVLMIRNVAYLCYCLYAALYNVIKSYSQFSHTVTVPTLMSENIRNSQETKASTRCCLYWKQIALSAERGTVRQRRRMRKRTWLSFIKYSEKNGEWISKGTKNTLFNTTEKLTWNTYRMQSWT
jgi:hypothetical protein